MLAFVAKLRDDINMLQITNKLIKFFSNDLWLIKINDLPKAYSFALKQLRIFSLAIQGFYKDQCALRASALTFYVLLSIVPLVAMLFGIAKGFGMEKLLESKLYEKMEGQEEVVARIVEFSKAFLEHTQGGIIAGVGVILLFWTTIRLLSNIEAAFNHIWGVQKSRSPIRKISDYLSLILVCPVLIILSSSVTVIVTSKINEVLNFLIQALPVLESFDFLIFFSVKLIPYLVIWILFTFIYIFIPNTKVKFHSAFMAGIIAGTCFQILQWLYINFQLFLSSYGAIYGSFSALPLFLVWLQVSWIIILFGAQIAFAFQNVDLFEFEPKANLLSNKMRKILSLSIVNLSIKFFKNSEALTEEDISKTLNIPLRLVNTLLFELTESQVLVEVSNKNRSFLPGKILEEMSIYNSLELLETNGLNEIPFDMTNETKEIKSIIEQISSDIQNSSSNTKLEDI